MRIALNFYVGIRQQDADVILRLIGDKCTFEICEPAPDGAVYSGKEAIASYIDELLEMSSQHGFESEDIVGCGKRCIVFWRYEDDTGEEKMAGIRGVELIRVKDNIIQEIRSYVKGSLFH